MARDTSLHKSFVTPVVICLLSTVIVLTGCGESAKSRSEGIEDLQAIKRRWDDGVNVAGATSRIALSGPAMNLQQIRRDLDGVKTSECLTKGKLVLADGMDTTISDVLAFMRDSLSSFSYEGASLGTARYEEIVEECSVSESDVRDLIAARKQRAVEKAREEAKAAAIEKEEEAKAAARVIGRENRSQYLSLLARTARLAAMAEGKEFTVPPEVLVEAPEIAAAETLLYKSSRDELASQIAIASQQLAQREQELQEASAMLKQASRSYDLSNQELQQTEALVKSGAVPEIEVMRLERELSRLRGDREQAGTQVTRAKAGVEKAQRTREQVERDFRDGFKREFSEATVQLNSLVAGSTGVKDDMK